MPALNEEEYYGCYVKKPYASWHIGADAARLARIKTRERIYPYRCTFCKMIHIGHVNKFLKKKYEARTQRKKAQQ